MIFKIIKQKDNHDSFITTENKPSLRAHEII